MVAYTARSIEPSLFRELLKRHLEGPSALTQEASRRFQLLPLRADLGGFVGLRQDGELMTVTWDEEGLEPTATSDKESRLAAVTSGARRYPELSFLIPPRPESAVGCKSCSGTGWIPKSEPEIQCGRCWGLGWVEESWTD